MKSFFSTGSIIAILLLAIFLVSEAQQCSSSGEIIGTSGQCNQKNGAECCEDGKPYPTYTCSPPVSGNTQAKLTLNSFEEGGDGGGPSKCDSQYHDDNTLVVALSTGWYDNNSRCLKNITINGNGMSVDAMVVDECDSTKGCDEEHDYQPPCHNNVVDASKAVWEALSVSEDKQGDLDITWSDA